jgi:coatomer subunit beta
VKYEAATTLTLLTQNPAAVKGSFSQSQPALIIPLIAFVAAASTFVNLVVKESDNNVKLIVLDRLEALRAKHGHALDGLIMDILQVLSRSVLVTTIAFRLTHCRS